MKVGSTMNNNLHELQENQDIEREINYQGEDEPRTM